MSFIGKHRDPMKYWLTLDGREILITRLGNRHLENILNMLEANHNTGLRLYPILLREYFKRFGPKDYCEIVVERLQFEGVVVSAYRAEDGKFCVDIDTSDALDPEVHGGDDEPGLRVYINDGSMYDPYEARERDAKLLRKVGGID